MTSALGPPDLLRVADHVADPVHDLAAAAVQHAVVTLAPDAPAAARAEAAAVLARARADAAHALEGGSAFAQLCRQAGLRPDEAELLALLVGTEHDEHLQQLLVSLTGDRERHRVELWEVPHLLPSDDAPAIGPGSGLVTTALVELAPRGAFSRTALHVPPRVLWALWGDGRPDLRLPVGLTLVPGVADGAADPAPVPDGVLVVGPDRVQRRRRAAAALAARALLVTPPPVGDEAWAALVREATLAGCPVLLEVEEGLDADGRRWVEAAHHLRWALASTEPLPLDGLPDRDWRELGAGTVPVTHAEWAAVMAGAQDQPPGIGPEQVERLGRAVGLAGGDVPAAYRRLTPGGITRVATRVTPRAAWSDLVLPAGRVDRLRHLVDRYRSGPLVYGEWGVRPSPSRGLVALFSGPSGTGKTMSAEVVAGELGLQMYQLDLSAVVSKYIGETEKNLDELFAAASLGGTLLFFDEADAMFGKRTEVRDAHDRYANVGTSYLLQRLERYDGVVVLATNFEKNIDEAFVRRVHVRVEFALPGPPERARLWRAYLDGGMPLAGDIDVDWLVGRFELSGASIRNTVVDAAFLAARDGEPVGMRQLAQGLAREMHKSSRLVRRETFGEWFEVASAATAG